MAAKKYFAAVGADSKMSATPINQPIRSTYMFRSAGNSSMLRARGPGSCTPRKTMAALCIGKSVNGGIAPVGCRAIEIME